ncbi:hypothetical protein [Nocardiopsis nanhaiensis]
MTIPGRAAIPALKGRGLHRRRTRSLQAARTVGRSAVIARADFRQVFARARLGSGALD